MRANSVELQQQLQSLAERFASLDDKKKALFLEKLEAESISFDQLPIVARRGDAGDWPLSPPQEALWLAAQLHPEDTSYHLSFAIDITGSLDVERLSVAFDELLLKHPVLRLRFVEPSEDERNPGVSVCQQVVPFSARRLEVTETSQSGLYAALSEHAARPIHLGQGRPVSLALFRLGSERHVLSFVAHHLVFDNQSFLLLASELVAAYLRTDESVAGVDAAPGAVDFIDYCRWQRDWARSPAFATQSQHWGELFQDREALAQAQGESLFEPLVLPSDLAALRSEQVPVGGQRHRFAIDAEVCRGLESVCAQRNISFYTLLMSAFGLALSQAAGRRSFTLGTSVANRSRPEVASALGMFVNTLLLPITREDSLSAGQWLLQQHDTVSLALGAPDVPVESILRDAQKLTDTSFGQLCRVFFVLLDNSELMDTGVAAKGAVLKLLDPFENSDRGPDLHHDLCLRVFRDRQQGGCQCQLEFLPQSIDAQSVAGIETLLQRWLDTLSDPQALSLPLGELAARSVESQRMPELQTAGSTSESVIARIALQASEYPEAIALSDDAGDVTYRALLGEIHIIAEWYRRLGCDEGAIVLLQMPRHRMQVIHSLALLALGASYLPLEPDMPTQRLENLVALCGPLCRVIDGAPMDPRDALGNTVLPTYTAVTPQAVVEMYDLAIAGPQEPRLPHVSGDAVAYNIMTSGSSGTPKCVQVSHRAILAYVDAVMPALNLESDATLASLSSVAADLAYTAVFGALLTGRCLRLLAADVATDAAQLATIGQQRPVDCMKLVPTHLQALLRVTDGDAILPRQCLVLGGEALPIGLVREVRRRAPGLRIINHYGPTECCVGVSVQVVDDEQTTDSFQWSHLPIGTALPQATLFTCNRFGEPLPAGLAGELLIGGESLAAGYLDDAAATAAAFTEHAGQRCYRSGDRVKRLLNGQYLFLERQDRQVKIRGHRIELTEIEQQFLAADGVVDAFATLVSVGQTEQLGIVAAGPELSADSEASLARFAAERLPSAMRPSVYQCYSALPLNRNGKLDRGAMRDALSKGHSNERDDEVTQPVYPRDDWELKLAGLWAEQLGCEVHEVPINRGFADLGGDSILGLQLIARARMSGIVFSPKQLFAAPSIEALLELANYPAKAIEERVTRVWSEVLERPVEQLGRVKDFLALGGDSILALQVIAQVRELGIVVTPKQFFANPTIAAIASCADFEASTREQSVQDSLQTRQFDTAIEPFSMATVDSRTLSAWQDDPNVSDAYPATATQRGMLFHSLLSPGRGLYTNQFVARMSEVRLEGSRLQSVLTVLAGRHSVLRSRIHLPDSDGELEENAAIEPHIVVDALVEPSLSVLNWRDREAKDHRQDLKILMRSELDRGIDLLQAPLMRLTLIETRLEQYLLWTFHHAVLDGWSIGHLVEETFALYSNAETKLPERLDVSRYVQWLGSQDLPGSLREWKAYLEGFEEPNALPLRTPVGNAADKAVSAMGAYRSTYTAELTRSSVAAARTAGVTHNTLLQAAWSWLIANLSRQWDVVFGVTLAGRPTDLSGADGMIGAFINTVPLRIEMTMDETVTEFVQSLQRNAMALQERSFVPLMDIQRQSDCKDALFQSLWVFENHPIARPGGGVGGLFEGMEVASADTGGTELPLTLWVYPGEQLRIHFTYDAALVDAVQVERIATLMSRAVALVVDGVNDSLRLSQLCLADASDQRFYQRISESAKSEHDGPDHLYARFLTAAHSFAERVAVRADGPRSQQLSYGELAQRVNQLAHHLLKQDLGRGDRVAVHVERGADMLVAVLAVQAIGAAYVPLDTSFPAQRLAMIVEDAQPGCLLDTAARPLLCELPQPCRRLVMDDASITSALARYPNEAPNIDRSGEDVAYVIYTSGSTGRPKGVVIRQRSLVNLLLGMQAELELQLDDRMLAVTSLSFDIATVELYLPLLVGAETVIAAAHQVMDAEYLASRLAAEHPFPITTMQATPASWELLLQAGWRRHSDLTVLCGGEALSESLATALLDSIPASAMPSDPAPVFNCYGPTETTVWSALNRVCPDTLTAIGRPLANNALRVLGEHGQLQPVGVAGELWIGGRGVASGYHERPELTADRFRWMDGELWYGTGDLALLDKNGQYHCLGRLDHQVKIRGFRIELGDIEAALLALPAVAQACVVVRYRDAMNSVWRVDATSSAEPQLVAYWVPAASHADAAEVHSDWSILQGLLRAVLPEYMVPGHAVAMPALPLTPNGKVDRRSLPAPEDATPGDWEAAARWLSAADSLGQAVYQVFAQTLGIEQFSPAAHFFDLGGHSLLAMQAVARLQRLARDRGLGDVDIQLFFESPTVIGIHERLAAMDGPGTVPVDALLLPPPLQADQSRGCAPLSFAQQRLWAADQLHSAGSDVYNMAAAVRLTGQIDWQKLERAFVALLERQTALRTALLQTDFGIEQRVCDLSSFQLPRLTLNVSAREQDTLVEEHFHMLRQQPFQLDGGCLLRVQALDFGSEAVLLLCVHHIAFDAWSAGVLLRDLSDSYLRQCSGQEGSLATLPVDYLDYANWQRSYLKGRYLEQRLDFWRQQMAGAPESLALPFARPQQDVASAYAGGEVRVALEAELLDDLRALARDADATLFMVLSAVYYTVLRAFTGHEDVVFGTDVANRLDPSLESVVGFFVNVVPLRFRQPGSHSFRQLMSAVRSQLLEVYRHQDVPFDRLVDELGARGQQGSNPLVQSLLVLQNAPFSVAPSAPLNGAGEDKIVPPGMTMLDLDNQVSRFDVSLFATESGGGLSLVWKFRRARYQERDVQQLATAFVALVRRATSDPEVSVQSMCDELAERRRCDTLSHRKKARRRIGRAAQVSESSSDHLSLEQHSPVTKESMEP